MVLKAEEAAGWITDLKLQVKYPMIVNGLLVCTYTADFTYTRTRPSLRQKKAEFIVEDVKGYRTRDYLLKKKLMKALYGLSVTET